MLPISQDYKNPSDELKFFQKQFYEAANTIGMRITEDALCLGDFWAAPGSAKIYNMTANFVDYLLNESDEKDYFDGVVYPSVPGEGLGFNICIRPSLIDEGVVQFLGASAVMLIKQEMEAKLSQIYDCEVVENGNLLWRNSDMLNKAIQNPLLFPDLLAL